MLPTLIDTRGLNLASRRRCLDRVDRLGDCATAVRHLVRQDPRRRLLAPLGVALCGAGLASVGICHPYLELASHWASGLG